MIGNMAPSEAESCSACPHWKSEPWWKQVFFFWRVGLWLGRCERGCYGGAPSWHGSQCGHR